MCKVRGKVRTSFCTLMPRSLHSCSALFPSYIQSCHIGVVWRRLYRAIVLGHSLPPVSVVWNNLDRLAFSPTEQHPLTGYHLHGCLFLYTSGQFYACLLLAWVTCQENQKQEIRKQTPSSRLITSPALSDPHPVGNSSVLHMQASAV